MTDDPVEKFYRDRFRYDSTAEAKIRDLRALARQAAEEQRRNGKLTLLNKRILNDHELVCPCLNCSHDRELEALAKAVETEALPEWVKER